MKKNRVKNLEIVVEIENLLTSSIFARIKNEKIRHLNPLLEDGWVIVDKTEYLGGLVNGRGGVKIQYTLIKGGSIDLDIDID